MVLSRSHLSNGAKQLSFRIQTAFCVFDGWIGTEAKKSPWNPADLIWFLKTLSDWLVCSPLFRFNWNKRTSITLKIYRSGFFHNALLQLFPLGPIFFFTIHIDKLKQTNIENRVDVRKRFRIRVAIFFWFSKFYSKFFPFYCRNSDVFVFFSIAKFEDLKNKKIFNLKSIWSKC